MRRARNGFTLIEAVLSIAIVALTASIIGGVYAVGLRSVAAQEERVIVDAMLRSCLEETLSQAWDTLRDAEFERTLNGRTFEVERRVLPIDLDGDGAVESDALQVVLTTERFPELALTTLLVDHGGRVAKL